MTTVLMIPGLICDGHVWATTKAVLDKAGQACAVADVTTQSSITDMAQSLLDNHKGLLLPVGHSMGGRIAMEMARIAPDRLQGMALLSTGMHPLKPGETEKRKRMIALARDQGMAALAERWLPGMMAEGLVPDPTVMKGLTDMVLRMTPEIHERQLRALIGRPDATKTIGDFKGQMLLVVGRQDQWSPVSQHEAIKALCPQASLSIIENAGHFVPVEQPGETAARISDWAAGVITVSDSKAS
jgi:pimeloyl-ACP methyl ester carboxylesterase